MLHAYEWNLEILWEDCDEWEDTGYSGLTLEEEKTSKQDIVLKNANFDDVIRYMKRTSISCFHVDYTLFKHEPFIRYHRRYYNRAFSGCVFRCHIRPYQFYAGGWRCKPVRKRVIFH